MLNGLIPPVIQADMNGGTYIDGDDVARIQNAVTGKVTFAWWNSFTNIGQRIMWVEQTKGIDRTDKHPYSRGFVCLQFATQYFLNMAGFRADHQSSIYSGGQTVFNIPMYYVGIAATNLGHAINGVLVGDDPLQFSDWRFIEPQTDATIIPGMWDMPYNSEVKVKIPTKILHYGNGLQTEELVYFYVDESGNGILQSNSPNLVLTRPALTPVPLDNYTDHWNPRLIPNENGQIIFDQQRDDLSRVTDLHVSSLAFSETNEFTSLTGSPQYSRIRDICVDPQDDVHLLWTGKTNYSNGLFHGIYDPVTRQLISTNLLIHDIWKISSARFIELPNGDQHLFWLQPPTTDRLLAGVYWMANTGSGWGADTNITADMTYLTSDDSTHNGFDVIAASNTIHLVWDHRYGKNWDEGVRVRTYESGTWSSSVLLSATDANAAHVSLAVTSDRKVHCIMEQTDVLKHSIYDAGVWSAASNVNTGGSAAYPHAFASTVDDSLYMVWERGTPGYSHYVDGVWSSATMLNIRSGAVADKPNGCMLSDGSLAFTWSSRSDDRSTIESVLIPPEHKQSNYNNVTLAGSFNAWDETLTNMSLTADYFWEATLTLTNQTSVQFKFTANNAWLISWGENNDQTDYDLPITGYADQGEYPNIFCNDTLNGTYRFTFNETSRYYTITEVIDDADSDGMPDAWETLYSLNPADPSDAGLDPDHDGATNLEEYQQGTNPTVWNGPQSSYASMTIAGSFNGWDETSTNMVLISDYTWRFDTAFSNQNGITFKMAANSAWDDEWGDNSTSSTSIPLNDGADHKGADISITDLLNGHYRFTFNEQTLAYQVQSISVPDCDDDSIDDRWERLHGLSSCNAQDRYSDPDGDQLSNLQEFQLNGNPNLSDSDGDGASDYHEYIAGTLLNNDQSVLAMTTTFDPTTHTLSWPGMTGRIYAVTSCAQLDGGTWNPLPSCESISGSNTTMNIVVSNAPINTVRYYRITCTKQTDN